MKTISIIMAIFYITPCWSVDLSNVELSTNVEDQRGYKADPNAVALGEAKRLSAEADKLSELAQEIQESAGKPGSDAWREAQERATAVAHRAQAFRDAAMKWLKQVNK